MIDKIIELDKALMIFLNKNISKDLRIYTEDNDFIGLGRLENSYLKHKQLV